MNSQWPKRECNVEISPLGPWAFTVGLLGRFAAGLLGFSPLRRWALGISQLGRWDCTVGLGPLSRLAGNPNAPKTHRDVCVWLLGCSDLHVGSLSR